VVEYEQRVEAAKVLAGGPAPGATETPGDLESAELALLASGSAPPPVEAAQPFFFHARLAAAAAANDAADRIRLLREAVAMNTGHSRARLDLFGAARAAGQNHLAVAAAQPLLANTSLAPRFEQYDSPLDQEQPDVDVDNWLTQQFVSTQGLSDDARAALAADLGQALEQTGRLGLADLLYRIAVELSANDLQRQAITRSSERVQATRRLQAENARRRPVISEHLEQEHLVRPRLAAAAQAGGAR
jgi:hypothetical protein